MRIRQNLTQIKKIDLEFLKPKVMPKVMPNMKICRKLEMGQRHTLAQCLERSYLTGRVFKIHDIFMHGLIEFLC